MLVGEGGRVLGSVTIGGCVDAQVIEESADVLGKNAPAAPRAESGRRGGLGDRAHLRRHHRGLPGAGDARRQGRHHAGLLRAGPRPRRAGRAGRDRDPPRCAEQWRQAPAPRPRRAGGHARRRLPRPALHRGGPRGHGRGASRGRCSSRTCAPSRRSSRRPPRWSWWGRATWRCRSPRWPRRSASAPSWWTAGRASPPRSASPTWTISGSACPPSWCSRCR